MLADGGVVKIADALAVNDRDLVGVLRVEPAWVTAGAVAEDVTRL